MENRNIRCKSKEDDQILLLMMMIYVSNEFILDQKKTTLGYNILLRKWKSCTLFVYFGSLNTK